MKQAKVNQASCIPVHCAHARLADITTLVPNPRNPNKHGDAQVALLAKIIRHQGWRAPITISRRSGFVVTGHGRLEAAKLLQVEQVPVDEQDFATEADEWAHLIADNRIAELADPSRAELATLLAELDTGDFDMDVTGFDYAALEELMTAEHPEGEADAEPQIDKAAELNKVWQVKPSDLWRVGEHRLLCGDSTKADDVARVMGGEQADLCFTSPPYGAGNVAKLRDHYVPGANKRESFYNDHKDKPDEWAGLMEGWFAAARPISDCVICNVQMLADNKSDLLRWVTKRADDFVDVVIWDKVNGAPQMQAGVMSNAFEFLFIFGGNGSRAIPFADWHGTVSNIVRIDPRGKNNNADNHRAVMPSELVVWVLNVLCPNATSAFDPFCGTGTTMVACENLGRKCRGIEISPDYCAVILQRMKDAFPNITIERV